MRALAILGAAAGLALAGAGGARAADCAGLSKAAIDGVTVSEASLHTPSGQGEVCRIKGEARTSARSSVKIEVWLPTHWNHKFLVSGWAFYAGTMNPAILQGPAAQGYATATTDGGGMPGDPSFFLGHPDKVKDWGERAWHVTTLASKALIRAYYGEPAKYAYWNGGGGAARQGLKEAQAFPGDYDGVVVGGLANDTSHFAFAQIAEWQAVHPAEGGPVRASVLPLLHKAVVAACPGGSGALEGLVIDPPSCRYDPVALQCRSEVRADCLSPAEVAAFRKLYAPVANPKSGKVIFGGLARGGELNWKGLIEQTEPQSYALDFFKYLVFADPAWDWRTLDFDRDVARAEAVDPSVNGLDADLRPFFARGGKLLIWGGWADDAIPPSANTGYYEAVMRAAGPKAARSIRLFMVPGMAHFPGRKGADAFDFDTQPLMEAWREHGARPDAMAVSHWSEGAELGTFTACPYPQHPVVSGHCS